MLPHVRCVGGTGSGHLFLSASAKSPVDDPGLGAGAFELDRLLSWREPPLAEAGLELERRRAEVRALRGGRSPGTGSGVCGTPKGGTGRALGGSERSERPLTGRRSDDLICGVTSPRNCGGRVASKTGRGDDWGLSYNPASACSAKAGAGGSRAPRRGVLLRRCSMAGVWWSPVVQSACGRARSLGVRSNSPASSGMAAGGSRALWRGVLWGARGVLRRCSMAGVWLGSLGVRSKCRWARSLLGVQWHLAQWLYCGVGLSVQNEACAGTWAC